MALNPNTTFTSGAVFTADQANRFPFGIVALATSSTSYTVTTSTAIATGMNVTFTAIANRYYKITYFEPQVLTPSAVNGFVSSTIRLTNAAGAAYVVTYNQTNSVAPMTQIGGAQTILTFGAGSVTLVGCSVANTTTGAPTLTRAASAFAYLMVEDVGPA